ncbi:MAG: hypothetical protein ACM3ZC_11605 [Bacteroidota bacterium]
MYCPGCKSEFREGFVFCQKCQLDLVDSLPESDIENAGQKTVITKILSLRVEDVLKYGGLAYIVIDILEELSRNTFDVLRNAELRSASGLDLFALIMSIAFKFCNVVLWGMFFVGFGYIIRLLKKATTDE